MRSKPEAVGTMALAGLKGLLWLVNMSLRLDYGRVHIPLKGALSKERPLLKESPKIWREP